MPRVFSRRIFTGGPLGLALALGVVSGQPPLAAPTPEQILYQSVGLRIFRAASRQGTPVIVLTNLDDEGNALAGSTSSGEDGDRAARPVCGGSEAPCSPPPADVGPAGRTEVHSPNTVRVLVQQGGDAAPVAERDVEVQSGADGGTIVIVNINPPAAPEKEAILVPTFAYPLITYGGLPGPFHYPDHLYFLGYGPGNNTPVSFGGLGLDSTDRYARAACGAGGTGPGCAQGSRISAP